MKKRVIHRLKGNGARCVRVERIAPEVGPAAPRWAVTAERVTQFSRIGPVRLVVRAAAKRVAGLPAAWEEAFRAARAEIAVR